jgi:hypothetical protein
MELHFHPFKIQMAQELLPRDLNIFFIYLFFANLQTTQ